MNERRSVTKEVIDYFIENIEKKKWEIGRKIPSENTLTKELGVSRSSVRAAIQQFIGVGVMESVKRKGTYLLDDNLSRVKIKSTGDRQFDYVDMNSLLEFRLVLECDSAYLGVMRASDENISNLRFYLEKMKESVGKPQDFVHYDMLFHEEIIRATDNILLQNAYETVMNQKRNTLEKFNEAFGYKDGIYYHTLILKAMESKDAAQAKRIMKSHLQKAIDDIYYQKMVETDVEFFENI